MNRHALSAIMTINRTLLWAGAALGHAVALTAQALGVLARSLASPFTWVWKRWRSKTTLLESSHTDTLSGGAHEANLSPDQLARNRHIARAIEEVMSRVGRSDDAIQALWQMIRQKGFTPAEVGKALLRTPYAHYALHIDPSINDTLHQGLPFIFHTDGKILLLHDLTPETIEAVLAAHPHDRDFHRQLSIALHQVMDYKQAQKRISDHHLPSLDDFVQKNIDAHYHLTIHGRRLVVQDKENGQTVALTFRKNAIDDLRRALPKLPDLAIRYIAVQWQDALTVEEERLYRQSRYHHDSTRRNSRREDRYLSFRRNGTPDEGGKESDFTRRQYRGDHRRPRPGSRDGRSGRDLGF